MDNWQRKFHSKLIEKYGDKKGQALSQKYLKTFSHAYQDEHDVAIAVTDIDLLENISATFPIDLIFYVDPLDQSPIHLRLFQWEDAIALSDILPVFENFGLRTESENSHKIEISNQEGAQHIWISDFKISYPQGSIDVNDIKELFKEAFIAVYNNAIENDGLNKLVLGALLNVNEIIILRAYTKYLKQIGFRFSQLYIQNALINNITITKKLISYFLHRHELKQLSNHQELLQQIEQQILDELNNVASLDEDMILRRFLSLLKATIRTNYFQKTKDNQFKAYLSLKFNSKSIPELPLPFPLYEVFVYSARFEGIHLRNTKVARGGIRWSDRKEDFRTEILGLMKAQVVKNAVIVPSGAKGGFVLKKERQTLSREELQKEVIFCYSSFIRGLLDITDNLIDNEVIPPKDVTCHDDADSYLVVAADKGTATFSDIANSISQEYNFWLDDAFASGGSTGYDHKKIGITARGAFESIKRHFRELNVDITKTDFTVVGIGDMSGDVFGNGMIYTDHIKLLAAFDHRNIFIDPTPDPKKSYQERLRVFHLPISSWEDYNPKLISEGGGVFKRSLKSISITKEMQNVLGITEPSLSPNDLIKAILKAPVDLLYNGGIGTYVKASTENNFDVGDRTNDYTRVDGNELRAKIVGEGGNLGFTQNARIEFSLNNGIINTDFIDNSGGVDCSDHEVNLKILLNAEVKKKHMSLKERNVLLQSLTDDVAALVLKDNKEQSLMMSYSAFFSKKLLSLDIQYLKSLESQQLINRKIEFLPDDRTLHDRETARSNLTRPELAILLAYTKIHIKQNILATEIPENDFFKTYVNDAFPESIAEKYQKKLFAHPLSRDIIATQLSSQIIDEMGITFFHRIQTESGATFEEIIRAHAVASRVYETRELQKLIETLDFKVSLQDQYEMFYNLRRLISLTTRWFLNNAYPIDDIAKTINHYRPHIAQLEPLIPDLMGGTTKEYLNSLIKEFVTAGLAIEDAKHIAIHRAIYTTLNIVHVATKYHLDLIKTAQVYFASGEKMHLMWFRDQIANDSREGQWSTLARLTLRDDLDISQRALTIAILNHNKQEDDPIKLIDDWMEKNIHSIERWRAFLHLLTSTSQIDYTILFIAVREFMSIITIAQKGKVLS